MLLIVVIVCCAHLSSFSFLASLDLCVVSRDEKRNRLSFTSGDKNVSACPRCKIYTVL